MIKSITSGLVATAIAVPVLMFGTTGFATVQGTQSFEPNHRAVAFAKDDVRAHKRGLRGKRGKGHMFRHLDLTEAQRDQIFELRHGTKPQMRELRKRKHAAKRELREMIHTEQVDQSRVEALSTEMGEISAAMVRARVATQIEVMKVLTPEQRAKLKERVESRGRK
jgi:Spy/CpxP family protein refolding chaperone